MFSVFYDQNKSGYRHRNQSYGIFAKISLFMCLWQPFLAALWQPFWRTSWIFGIYNCSILAGLSSVFYDPKNLGIDSKIEAVDDHSDDQSDITIYGFKAAILGAIYAPYLQ